MKTPPQSARAVIIGGGVSGCSVAYHLAKLGWKDIVLLERKQLTCGTTWHAAGLVGLLRSSRNLTRLAKYSRDLYLQLEAETGVATGMTQTGSLSVALTDERAEELQRQAGVAHAFDVQAEIIDSKRARELYPYLNTDGVVSAVHLPEDGQCDPSNVAHALAKGARMNGAEIFEGIAVTEVEQADGRVTGIRWKRDGSDDAGQIVTDLVVNCAGMWARSLGNMAGVNVPLHACEHFYIVTEGIEDLPRLPVLRVPDEFAYYKEDAGKILLGAFEPKAKPWGMEGIPEDFCFDQLPEDFDHFEPILEKAINRMPVLETAGIHTFFNGPESFTPDDRYYLGEAPELSGFWVAAGYNSIGIASSGGAGMALAQWIHDNEPPFDLWDVDIRRAQTFQNNAKYLQSRVSETLGLLYADHFPYRQPETARGIRRSPIHEQLKTRNACFGEFAGWERANWFAPDGIAPEYQYSWKRQNWFEYAAAEHHAIRNDAGILDMSSFGKIRVEGADAEAFLNRICGNDVAVAPGRIVYTQFLNAKGGIEADVTVTRLAATSYLVVTPAATARRDMAWLRRHLTEDDRVALIDVTASEATICVMGPRSRDLIQSVSGSDMSHAAHPFGRARQIEIGYGVARAHRISYVGELGWELYVSADQAAHVFETLMEVAPLHNAKLCGLHTMDSCRIEKAFRHWGHDITDEDHVLEAGLGFAVKTQKPEFIGRDAVLRKRDEGVTQILLQFMLSDPEPLLFHNEPVLRDGKMVSYLTSGNYGHHLGAAIGMGYVPVEDGETPETVVASEFEISVAGTRVSAVASLEPMYDPRSERMRA